MMQPQVTTWAKMVEASSELVLASVTLSGEPAPLLIWTAR